MEVEGLRKERSAAAAAKFREAVKNLIAAVKDKSQSTITLPRQDAELILTMLARKAKCPTDA